MQIELQIDKRPPRITTRDLEVLDFVARMGLVSGSDTARWAGTGSSVSYRREARWRDSGLVRVFPPIGNSGRLLSCTSEGLRAVGRQGLKPVQISLGGLPHAVLVARLAALFECDGEPVWSEREIASLEGEAGRRYLSATLPDGRHHRPDLIVRDGHLAIELELSQKANWRLDAILRAWRRAIGRDQIGGVRYLCGGKALGPVQRSLKRTATEELIEVEPLGLSEVSAGWRVG